MMHHLMMVLTFVLLDHISLCFPLNFHLKENNVRVLTRERSDDWNTIHRPNRYSDLSHHEKRSERSELSISPSTASPVLPSVNSTQESNPPESAMERSIPPWVSSSETIVTAIFRTVMMILTLMNVNVSWKIHGMYRESSNYCD